MTHRITLALLVCATACGSPYDKALDRGIEAERAGDLHGAARAYREACARRPEKKDICRRAEIIADAAVRADVRRATPLCQAGKVTACRHALAKAEALVPDHPLVVGLYTDTGNRFLSRAEAACKAGDVNGCLAALSPARDLLPASARLQATIDRSGSLYADRCAARELTTPEDAVALVACLQGLTSHLSSAAYRQRLAEEATRASVVFAGVRGDWGAHLAGAHYAIDAAVSCFAPNDVSVRRARESRARFLALSTIPLVLETTGEAVFSTPEDGCTKIARAIGPAVGCQDPESGQAAPLALAIDVSVGSVAHDAYTTSHTVRYQSGTRTLRNPAYDPAAQRLRDAEQALRDAEREESRLDGECRAAESALSSASYCYNCPERTEEDRACSEHDAAEDLVSRRESDVDRARRELDNTPQLLHEPIYSDHRVVEEHHTWRYPYALRVKLGQGKPQTIQDQITFTDSTRAAFAPAGVTGDPFNPPPRGYFHRSLQEIVVAVGAKVGRTVAENRASSHDAACGGSPQWTAKWLQCWAEATLWAGKVPSMPALLARMGDDAASVTCLQP